MYIIICAVNATCIIKEGDINERKSELRHIELFSVMTRRNRCKLTSYARFGT